MTHVYPERERWLALGLLLAALLLVYALCVHPWWTVPMREVDQRISSLQERELRVRTQLQQAPQVQQQLEQARAMAIGRPGFLPEPSAELAVAGLVQRLETVVAQASPGNRSCAIQNRSPMPDSGVKERFQKVTVNVRLLCGAAELGAVLHALEGGSPRLFVESLDVLSQRYSFVGTAAGNSGLAATFNLSGYLAPPGALANAAPVLPPPQALPAPAAEPVPASAADSVAVPAAPVEANAPPPLMPQRDAVADNAAAAEAAAVAAQAADAAAAQPVPSGEDHAR